MAKFLVLLLSLFFFSFGMDPIKLMYLTYPLKERDFKKAVDDVKKEWRRRE
jgi:hypothetical protein